MIYGHYQRGVFIMDKESTEVHVSGVEAKSTVSPAEVVADKAFEAWVEAMELELKEAS
tara:strand:- start:147 stop:320 length:174 start_codon:yes stop_codon:yes gene_type:complete